MKPGRLRGRSSGLALVICLLVLAIVLVLAQAMGTLGVQHLGAVQSDYYDRISAHAAEAGAARALHELKADSTWSEGFSNDSLTPSTRAAYTVQVTNNTVGSGTATAPDGTSVPSSHVYLLSTGTCLDGRYPRKTAVMLTGGSFYPYAIASGGNLNIQGSADITGTVRAGGPVTFSGAVRIHPDASKGRLLSGANIRTQSTVTLEADQDVRAREDINSVSDIRGTTLVYPNDDTPDTDPFDAASMPQPDLDQLLAPGAYVEHSGAQNYRGGDILDLGGKVHYFPDGVTFGTGSKLEGSGTLVIGNGKSAVFRIPLSDVPMNIVALDSANGSASDASVEFFGGTSIRGVIYSQGNVTAHTRLDVFGAIIAYGSGDVEQIQGSAAVKVVRATPVVPLPGFEDLFGSGGSSTGLSIDSWIRL